MIFAIQKGRFQAWSHSGRISLSVYLRVPYTIQCKKRLSHLQCDLYFLFISYYYEIHLICLCFVTCCFNIFTCIKAHVQFSLTSSTNSRQRSFATVYPVFILSSEKYNGNVNKTFVIYI